MILHLTMDVPWHSCLSYVLLGILLAYEVPLTYPPILCEGALLCVNAFSRWLCLFVLIALLQPELLFEGELATSWIDRMRKSRKLGTLLWHRGQTLLSESSRRLISGLLSTLTMILLQYLGCADLHYYGLIRVIKFELRALHRSMLVV